MKLFLISLNFILASAVKIYSSSTDSYCDEDILFGSVEYIDKHREITRMLSNIGTGYELDLFFLSPNHFGCQLLELEIIAVYHDIETADQEFEDLSDDIRHNFEGNLGVKIFIAHHLSEIPLAMRHRLSRHIPRQELPLNIALSLEETQNRLRDIILDIAVNHDVRVSNIAFDARGIIVTLEGHYSRTIQNHLLLLARTRTRNMVRITNR